MPQLTGLVRYLVPLSLICGLCILFVPIPAAVMDILVAANLTVAVLIVMTSFTVARPLEFNVFPALLLATTMMRLCLNVATTRMILTDAPSQGTQAAGRIIATFGQQVTGDQLVVGIIIFSILVIVQLIVVTQGAARISEVAARFSLDGLPGRQMTIDADLSAGLIDKAEALRRRQELTMQTDFFGAMDGASKFLRGDAVASIVIIGVNLAGGLFRGVVQGGMSFSRASEVYSKLTIGDGLASQIPSVLISLAAGLLIARCSSPTDFSRQLLRQTVSSHGTAWAVAASLIVLGLVGLPLLPMLAMAVGVVLVSAVLHPSDADTSTTSTPTKTPTVEPLVSYDPLELELGVQLLPLAKPSSQGDLLSRLAQLRRKTATDLGIVVPRIRVRDNLKLAPNEFCLKILGNQVCHGRIVPRGVLAVARSAVANPLPGQSTRGLVSDMAQWWIDESSRAKAIAEGYRVLSPIEVLVEALQRAIARHADEILTRDAVQVLLASARKIVPAIVEEVTSGRVALGKIQKVLQQLVRERIPLKQLPRILEAICDVSTGPLDSTELTNSVRVHIAGSISATFRDRDGRLRCARLSADLEHTLNEAVQSGLHLRPATELQSLIHNICRELERQTTFLKSTGLPQVLLVPQELRHHLVRWTARFLPDLVVLGDREITADTHLVHVATIGAVAVAA